METSANAKQVTIAILTKNAGPRIAQVLQAVFSQETHYSYEVLVIDSGSTDGTVEYVRQHPIRLDQIAPSDFHHAGTRNRAVQLASGEFVVFLTQDATPANPYWLDYLVGTVAQDPRNGGAYGRQKPYANCSPCQVRNILGYMGGLRQIKAADLSIPYERAYFSEFENDLSMFANVSSCVRRDLALRIPFDESLIMCEDKKWAHDVLEAGYRIIYEPLSVVYHSHDFSLRQLYRRYYDQGLAFGHIAPTPPRWMRALRWFIHEVIFDWLFLFTYEGLTWPHRLPWYIKSLFVRSTMILAQQMGAVAAYRELASKKR